MSRIVSSLREKLFVKSFEPENSLGHLGAGLGVDAGASTARQPLMTLGPAKQLLPHFNSQLSSFLGGPSSNGNGSWLPPQTHLAVGHRPQHVRQRRSKGQPAQVSCCSPGHCACTSLL